MCERGRGSFPAPALLEGVAQLSETQLVRRAEKRSADFLGEPGVGPNIDVDDSQR
jgi:hypothetical protein